LYLILINVHIFSNKFKRIELHNWQMLFLPYSYPFISRLTLLSMYHYFVSIQSTSFYFYWACSIFTSGHTPYVTTVLCYFLCPSIRFVELKNCAGFNSIQRALHAEVSIRALLVSKPFRWGSSSVCGELELFYFLWLSHFYQLWYWFLNKWHCSPSPTVYRSLPYLCLYVYYDIFFNSELKIARWSVVTVAAFIPLSSFNSLLR